jgi:Zn ribbon nucleic-acid-binding protein
MLTTQVQEGSELWDALCNEHFQCVILEDRFALVVWREERIGVLELEKCYGYTHGSETRHLRDMVRSERRTVIVR